MSEDGGRTKVRIVGIEIYLNYIFPDKGKRLYMFDLKRFLLEFVLFGPKHSTYANQFVLPMDYLAYDCRMWVTSTCKPLHYFSADNKI